MTSPGNFSDNSSQGYFSDHNTSIQSQHLSPYSHSQSINRYNIKQELPDSTTDTLETSAEEDDVLDAIAEWQQM